ncbi:MAG: tRNA-modifying protein YgfZ [Verrucomicrobiota bacterium]|jgi:folate-binding protein YgfZ
MTAIVQRQTRGIVDLSTRAKFRVAGPDSFRFLNGQITNDLRKASSGVAIEACVLNAKGKIDAHVFISEADGGFFLDGEPALREILPARLDRYIIADDVQVEDVTERFALFHLLDETRSALPNEWRAVRAWRLGVTGWDFWIDMTQHDVALKESSTLLPTLTGTAGETLRIEMGVPRWGFELGEEIIPIEANLETRAIDYEKGCYIGQEVISRMKMSGQTNKRLCGIVSIADEPLAAGMRLVLPGTEKDAGWISSATRSKRLQKEIALGFVKRGHNDAGTKLHACRSSSFEKAGAIPVEVVALPFI